MGENDAAFSLLDRGLQHIEATAKYSIYYGEGRDSYDVPAERGRTTHEAIFNPNDGRFRCPNSQQGFSGFTTWTRGLSWAMVGFAEELEFLKTVPDADLAPLGGRAQWEALLLKGAKATCDWFIAHTPTDGIPYWDGGAPNLHKLGDWRSRPAEIFNHHEPVDSSAAAIGVQGLLRLGRHRRRDDARGQEVLASRPHHDAHAAQATTTSASTRRTRACFSTRSITVRTAGTIFPPAGRSRAAKLHVGRLPPPRSRPPPPAHHREQTVLHLLRLPRLSPGIRTIGHKNAKITKTESALFVFLVFFVANPFCAFCAFCG
ncbi:MAG: hypothetical protein WDM96_18295 [Lacunisphaera sp.]